MPGTRRVYKSMTLPGRGRVLSLERDDDEEERGGHVFRTVTSDAPGAAPAKVDGDARVDVVMTACGRDNNVGERVSPRGRNAIILRRPKGFIKSRKFVIGENNIPSCRDFYSMWDDAPLPNRVVHNPDDDADLFRPTPDEEDWLLFQCRDYHHAVECAGKRLEHYRLVHGLTASPYAGTRLKYTNPRPYVSITNPHNVLEHVKARFFYEPAPVERNPLDNVLGQGQETQATAFAVCDTGAEALAEMDAFLGRQIVWETTIAEAMDFCIERFESELPRERGPPWIWLPPAGAATPPA